MDHNIKLPGIDNCALNMEGNGCVHNEVFWTFTMKYFEVKAHDESTYS